MKYVKFRKKGDFQQIMKERKIMKQSPESNLIQEITNKLRAVFDEISFAKINAIRTGVALDPSAQADLIVELEAAKSLVRLVVEVKASGEPRIARTAGFRLQSFTQSRPDAYGLFVAPYISERSRQVCKEMGIGCLDLAGNIYLDFNQIFIDRQGYPNPFKKKRPLKSVFSPKASRVLKILLADPFKRWYVQDIAKEAHISLGQASAVKKALLDLEWIREEKKAFWLAKPKDMLLEWAEDYDYRKNRSRWFYSPLSKAEIEEAIGAECERRGIRYALALFSAADRIAPFTSSPRTFAFVEKNVDEVAEALRFKPVNTGANVILLEPYDEGVFYGVQEVRELKVVSDVQAYLDLKSYAGRGEEAAQALYEERLRSKWSKNLTTTQE